jgi:hypothetical protein
MYLRSTVRPIRGSLKFALPFLSLALFCWGLHAKLTLYEKPSPTRLVTVAKIIEAKKATDRIEISALALPRNLPEPLVHLFAPPLPVSHAIVPSGDIHLVSNILNRSIRIYPSELFFRPPPSTLKL